MLSFTTEQLSEILEEIANFEVELEEDPTLPTLGIKYLNSKVASCRKYLNRVSYYIQVIGRQLKDLRLQVNQYELDLEFKISMKLADDEIVRKQPSVEDRKALAIAMLRDEHEQLSTARMALMDTQETFKIIKMKHQDLIRTGNDIKTQRQLVKDDADIRMHGGEGFERPQANQDGTYPEGMAPPVVPGPINPTDLLNPNKRPDDMPEPVDAMHAQQIADFYNSHPENSKTIRAVTYDDIVK